MINDFENINIVNDLLIFCYFKLQNYSKIVSEHLKEKNKFKSLNSIIYIAISYNYLNLKKQSEELYEEILGIDHKNQIAMNNLEILNVDKKYPTMNAFKSYNQECSEIANNFALVLIKNGNTQVGLKILQNLSKEILSSKDFSHKNVKIIHNYLNNSVKSKLWNIENFINEYLSFQENKNDVIVNLLLINLNIQNENAKKAKTILENLLSNFLDLNVFNLNGEQLKKYLLTTLSNLNETLKNQEFIENEKSNLKKEKEVFEFEKNQLQIYKLKKEEVMSNLSISCNNFNLEQKTKTELILTVTNNNFECINESFNNNKKNNFNNAIENNKKEEGDQESNYNQSNREVKRTQNKDESVEEIFLVNRSSTKSINIEGRLKLNFDNVSIKDQEDSNSQFNNKIEIKNEKDIIDHETYPSKEAILIDLYKDIQENFSNNNYDLVKYFIKRIKEVDADYKYVEIAVFKAKMFLSEDNFKGVYNSLNQFKDIIKSEDIILLIKAYQELQIEDKELKDLFIKLFDNPTYYIKYIFLEFLQLLIKLEDKETLINTLNKSLEFINNYNQILKISELLLNDFSASNILESVLDKMKTLITNKEEEMQYNYYLGKFYFLKGKINSAFEFLYKIEKEKYLEDNEDYNVTLAKVYTSLSNYKKSIALYKQALKINFNNWEYCYLIGENYLKLKNYESAEKYLNYAFKKHENSFKDLNINLALAKLNYNIKNFDQANFYFEVCLTIDPKCFKANQYIASIKIKNEQFIQAEDYLNHLVCLNDIDFFPLTYELFKLKLKLNKKEDALSLINKIDNSILKFSNLLIEYSLIWLTQIKDTDKAISYFDWYLNSQKDNLNNADIIRFIEKLDEYELNERVIKYCTKFKLNYPKEYSYYKLLSKCLIKAKNYSKATETLMEYYKINTKHLECIEELGHLYFINNEYLNSCKMYEIALQIRIKNNTLNKSDILIKAAISNIKLKKYEKGIDYIKRQILINDNEDLYLLAILIVYNELKDVDQANQLTKVKINLKFN